MASRSSWPFFRTAREPLDANYPNGPSWTCRPTCRSPDSRQALDELEHQTFEVFEANPPRASETATVIAVFYRQRADPGDVEALVELNDFLYWDELETARPALAIFKRIGANSAADVSTELDALPGVPGPASTPLFAVIAVIRR